MADIKTYVFFDIETTGLPWQEKNQTKITEASFIATTRKDIQNAPFGLTPPVSKLMFALNPKRPINPVVRQMNGLSNEMLHYCPTFRKKFRSLYAFLQDLRKPVCLVAHNGNNFDFKILLAECADANVKLPTDLLCVDTLIGFRKLLKGSTICFNNLKPKLTVTEELVTDDEDDWPELELSKSDLDEIDKASEQYSYSSDDESDVGEQTLKLREDVIKSVFSKKSNINEESFKLSALYKRLTDKEESNTHRAEVDCLMLLQCVIAIKHDFLLWADESARPLLEINPLVRY